MNQKIDAVLFDIGGVLLSSPFEGFAAYERAAGLPDRTIRTLNATNPDTNAWAHLERGDVDLAEFVERFEAEALEAGFVVDGNAVLEALRGHRRPRMIEAVTTCAATFKTALLTNDIASADTANANADLFEIVDAVVQSSAVGCRKPELRFYELACERLDVEPSACVFLDDLGINLKPARAMGMTTIKVIDPDDALAALGAATGLRLD